MSHLKLLTASHEEWDRPDLGVTCAHRCDRVHLLYLVSTEKLAAFDQPLAQESSQQSKDKLCHTKSC